MGERPGAERAELRQLGEGVAVRELGVGSWAVGGVPRSTVDMW